MNNKISKEIKISRLDVLKLLLKGLLYKFMKVLGKKKTLIILVIVLLVLSNILYKDIAFRVVLSCILIITLFLEKGLNKFLTVNRLTGELHMSYEDNEELEIKKDGLEKLDFLAEQFNQSLLRICTSKDPFIAYRNVFTTNTNEVIYLAFRRKYGDKFIAIPKKKTKGINEKLLRWHIKDLINITPEDYRKLNRKVRMYKIVFKKSDLIAFNNCVNQVNM